MFKMNLVAWLKSFVALLQAMLTSLRRFSPMSLCNTSLLSFFGRYCKTSFVCEHLACAQGFKPGDSTHWRACLIYPQHSWSAGKRSCTAGVIWAVNKTAALSTAGLLYSQGRRPSQADQLCLHMQGSLCRKTLWTLNLSQTAWPRYRQSQSQSRRYQADSIKRLASSFVRKCTAGNREEEERKQACTWHASASFCCMHQNLQNACKAGAYGSAALDTSWNMWCLHE